LSTRRPGRRARPGTGRRARQPRRAARRRRPVRAHLPGADGGRACRHARRGRVVSAVALPAREGAARGVASGRAPWRLTLFLVALCVLAGALLELVPPLVLRRVVDEHLTIGRADGLLELGLLYLGTTALALAATFGGTYLAAVAAQGALHELRVRLF